jgi:hypothetical protein
MRDLSASKRSLSIIHVEPIFVENSLGTISFCFLPIVCYPFLYLHDSFEEGACRLIKDYSGVQS